MRRTHWLLLFGLLGAYVLVRLWSAVPTRPATVPKGREVAAAKSAGRVGDGTRQRVGGPKEPPHTESVIPSLKPFPDRLQGLRANRDALAVATAIAQACDLRVEDYGASGEGGWQAEYDRTSGPFLILACQSGEAGWQAIIRASGRTYRYLLGLQDTPSVAEVRKAAITPSEYGEYLLPAIEEWPYDEASGSACKTW